MKKIVITFGLISGAISSAVMIATVPFIESHGYNTSEILGYTSIVLSALVVFFAVRSYRENVGAGRMTFGQGVSVGLLVVLISSLIYVATFQIIYFYAVPDFGEKFMVCMIEKERASGASAQELVTVTEQAQQFKRLFDQPLTNAAVTFLEPFPIGLVVALVSAAVLRKSPKTP